MEFKMLEPGSRLKSPNNGKEYRLIEDIGSGTYARCWSASVGDSSEKVCVKEIFYNQYSEAEKKNAAKEVELHSTFKNNYIIRFRESFMHTDDLGLSGTDTMIIVMDLADSSLDQIIMQRKEKGAYFHIEEAYSLFVQIASGVAYLHAYNLIHRDISSKNVLVMLKDPKDPLSQILMVKLADFGTCKQLDQKMVNMEHTAIGTIQTMAPEVLNEEGYDNKIDIWSLGCVLYEILTFNPLFTGGNFFAIMNRIQQYEVFTESKAITRRYQEHEHALVLTAILERALSKSPSKRPSCDDILKGLLNVPSFVRSPPHMLPSTSNAVRWVDSDTSRGANPTKERNQGGRSRNSSGKDRESVLVFAMNNVGTPTRSVSEPRFPTKSLRRSDSTKSSIASITNMSEMERERGRSAPRPMSSLAEVGLMGAGIGLRMQRELDERQGARRGHSPTIAVSNPGSRSVSISVRDDKRDPNVKVVRQISRSLLTQYVLIDFHDGVYKIGLDSFSRHSSRGHSRIGSRSSEPGDLDYETGEAGRMSHQPASSDVLASGIPAPGHSGSSHSSKNRDYRDSAHNSDGVRRDRDRDRADGSRRSQKLQPVFKKADTSTSAVKMATIMSEQRPSVGSSGSAPLKLITNGANGSISSAAVSQEIAAKEKAAHDARIKVARNTGSDVAQYQRDARRATKVENRSSVGDSNGQERKKGSSGTSSNTSASSLLTKGVTGHTAEIEKFKKDMLHQKSLKNIKEPEIQIYTGLPDATLKAMETN